MLVGYARVSTQDQNLDLQKDALSQEGCGRIFTDVAGGAQSQRNGLEEALSFLREGDSLVVWRLDRLGRSLKHLIESVSSLQVRKIGFRSLQEKIDTATSGGKLVFHVFGALAEFERDVIRERTQAGLHAARARGRRGGVRRLWIKRSWPWLRPYIRMEPARSRISATPWGSQRRRSTAICHPKVGPENAASQTETPLRVEDRCFFLRCYRNPK